MEHLYTADVTAEGGREGNVKSQDGNLNLQITVPEKMGGDGSAGTNPEQLFAAAYGSCFLSALATVAKHENVDMGAPKIIVKVSFNEDEKDHYFLSVALHVIDDAVADDVLNDLVKKTHRVCPYSKAIKDNIEVILTANQLEVEEV